MRSNASIRKRRFFSVPILLALAWGLAACGPSGGSGTGGTNPDSTGTGPDGSSVLTLSSNFDYVKIADTATPIPGGTGTFTQFGSFNAPAIEGQDVVFTGFGSGDQQGIYSSAGGLHVVVRRGDPMPISRTGWSAVFERFTGSSHSAQGGAVAFHGSGTATIGTGTSTVAMQGIFLADAGTTQLIADSQTTIPGEFAGGQFLSLDTPRLDDGDVSFSGTGQLTGSGPWRGIYAMLGGVLTPVADVAHKLPVPVNYNTTGELLPIGFNQPDIEGGDLVFVAFLVGSGHPCLYSTVGGMHYVRCWGHGVPDVNGALQGTLSFAGFGIPLLAGGEMAFKAPSGRPVGANLIFDRDGIYRTVDGVLVTVVDSRMSMPGSSNQFDTFGQPSFNGTAVAFSATGDGGEVGLFTDLGGTLETIAAVGDTLGGKTIADLIFGQQALSTDSLAFRVKFTDGSEAIYRATRLAPPPNSAPTANAGADQVVEATSPAGALVALDGTGSSDPDVDNTLTYDWSGAFGSVTGILRTVLLGLGSHTITLTVTDSGGLTDTDDVRIDVVDTTPPMLSVPAPVMVEAEGVLTAVPFGTAVATDAVDLTPTVTHDAPAAGFPVGTTAIHWTAIDDAGNQAHATQTVTVTDTTPPLISAPPDLTVEATGPRTPLNLTPAIASDLADPAPMVTHDAPLAGFPLGDTVVTWTATDASGNFASATQTVTVQDTTPPALTPPGPITREATGPLTTVALGTPSVSDLVDPAPAVTHNAPAGGFPVGTTLVTWSATDFTGNLSAATQSVTITDTTPPLVTPPPPVFAYATGPLTAVELGTATAVDLVDGALVPTPDPAGPFAPGTHTVIWRATDAHGNTGTATQTVVVEYDFAGFRTPIQNPPEWNVGNAGRTWPVKWQLRNPLGGFIGGLEAVSALRITPVGCDGTGSGGGATDPAGAGHTELRYDSGEQQYLFNWKTEQELAGQCRAFVLELSDGTMHQALFRFR